MPISEELKVVIKAEANRAVRELKKVSKHTQEATGHFGGMAKSIQFLKSAAVVGAVTYLGKQLFDIVTTSIKAAGAFETQKVAFEVLLGSAKRADSLLDDIREFAAATPFTTMGLIEGAKQLLAFGTEANDVVDTMRRLGDIAMGDQAKLDRLTYAFGKVQTKGKATLEELNLFLEAGVPILEELAKNYNVTTEEMLVMINKGKIGFADVNQALTTLTTGTGKFAGMSEKTAQTFEGMVSTLQSNMEELRIALGDLLLPLINEILPKLTQMVQGLTSAIKQWDDYSRVMKKVKEEGDSSLTIQERIIQLQQQYNAAMAITHNVETRHSKDLKARIDALKELLKEEEAQNLILDKQTEALNVATTAIKKQGDAVKETAKQFDSLFIAMQAVSGAAQAIAYARPQRRGGGVRQVTQGLPGGGAAGMGPATRDMGAGIAAIRSIREGRGLSGVKEQIQQIDKAVKSLAQTFGETLVDGIKIFHEQFMMSIGEMMVAFTEGAASMKEAIKNFIVSSLIALGHMLTALGPLGWVGASAAFVAAGVVKALAEGGIVKKPTLALIGEKGPEAVVPLNQGGGMGITINVHGSLITERELSYLVMKHIGRSARGY